MEFGLLPIVLLVLWLIIAGNLFLLMFIEIRDTRRLIRGVNRLSSFGLAAKVVLVAHMDGIETPKMLDYLLGRRIDAYSMAGLRSHRSTYLPMLGVTAAIGVMFFLSAFVLDKPSDRIVAMATGTSFLVWGASYLIIPLLVARQSHRLIKTSAAVKLPDSDEVAWDGRRVRGCCSG